MAATPAGELEARDDHERGCELDRAVRALGEHGGVARDLEREADVTGRERDLGGGEAAVELVARLGARVLRELDRTGALAGERASGREQNGDLGAGAGVERVRAVQLLEARQRGVEAELHQIDRGDDGGAARGEMAELAANARGERGRGELRGERGLTAQDLELGEIELGAQGTQLVSALATRAHEIAEQRGGSGGVTAAARDERAGREHLVGDGDGIEVASDGIGGIERGRGLDEAAFAGETDRAAGVDDRGELARLEAHRHRLARAVGTRERRAQRGDAAGVLVAARGG
ncbi:MAG TPA: hypothetical protein VLT45_32020, partial [Kofleriaceae bacterium]|nr:hypothetical protein [Kofleriaceae bacterium]